MAQSDFCSLLSYKISAGTNKQSIQFSQYNPLVENRLNGGEKPSLFMLILLFRLGQSTPKNDDKVQEV